MKILIDECVPWPIHRFLENHQCFTAQRLGWGGKKNGDLIRLAEQNQFQLFITADQNIRYQQNLSGRQIAILEVSTNKLRDLQAASATIIAAIDKIVPGAFVSLKID